MDHESITCDLPEKDSRSAELIFNSLLEVGCCECQRDPELLTVRGGKNPATYGLIERPTHRYACLLAYACRQISILSAADGPDFDYRAGS